MLLGNAGLSAIYYVVVPLGVFGLAFVMLVVATVSMLSRKRHDRPGVIRALAVADVVVGLAGLGLCVPLALFPVMAAAMGVLSLGLLFGAWKLVRNARSLESSRGDGSSGEEGFWEQFD